MSAQVNSLASTVINTIGIGSIIEVIKDKMNEYFYSSIGTFIGAIITTT